ncbi:hypothetical protein Harman_29980 [Haloarcula mannanilytica]|uniref:DUF1616 domain-containing protein n=1 Tax=Haloarcula mannanilytica TaxID=2509225 RepID=A0A4C2ER49_9EURY|nr:DUF1616 domain-containing protein [Haloarcula mannanilytica]GCF15063.1 hypothetical protein Harman_29980 [Haloarcula mannanilytica]
MGRWSDTLTAVSDLVGIVVLTAIALAATISPLDGLLLAAVAIPFLLFVPGYALIAALFPDRESTYQQHRLIGLERILYAVVASICLAVIVGVNLDFTGWPIRPVPVISVLAAVTLLSTFVALYRRFTSDSAATKTAVQFNTGSNSTSQSSGGGVQLVSIVVAVAILITLASVTFVAAQPQRGEAYTEFGLLIENNGTLQADGYPEEMTLGESSELYFTVTNREQQQTNYIVVVQLTRTAPTGDVLEKARLDTYTNTTDPGETWRQSHTVTPVLEGERLRLTYLLYRDGVPAQPTVDNAYREIHIWVDVLQRN